jgi:hypothetical protein
VKKKSIIAAIALFVNLLLVLHVHAQVGGNSGYNFLKLSNSARNTAMGGNTFAIQDNDINLALINPSLINESMNNNLSFSFVDYFSDINYGYALYSRTFKKFGSFTGGAQYLNYGKFIEADETGQNIGNFTAADYCMNIGWGKSLDSAFSVGANLKGIYSQLERYNSYGVAVDVAGTYNNPAKNFTASLLFSNIGRQIKPYTDGNYERLPFEIQIGMSKKLKYVPFRLSVAATHLEKFDLTYESEVNSTPAVDPLTNEPSNPEKVFDFADKVMRHFVLGGELIISKNLNLRLGYNYQRRKEMRIESKGSTVGFSWGFGIRVSHFHLSFARAKYHLYGSPNNITLTTNLSNFYKK